MSWIQFVPLIAIAQPSFHILVMVEGHGLTGVVGVFLSLALAVRCLNGCFRRRPRPCRCIRIRQLSALIEHESAPETNARAGSFARKGGLVRKELEASCRPFRIANFSFFVIAFPRSDR
ncbi:hypothetical protein B6V73_05600 [Thioclava sp. JM3]|uniref:hypothetical protein n=1 Tax=Thioclava sp. JM3 TaxID=1973004 RepID=UPI000B53DFFF|nr:hypothetical protein [Thioclava sp. JM3]OWY18082.1 hypothetical protein B6V73_05600 [Thioclava sp. JM3]